MYKKKNNNKKQTKKWDQTIFSLYLVAFFFLSFGSYCLVRQFKKHRIGSSAVRVLHLLRGGIVYDFRYGFYLYLYRDQTEERENFFILFYFAVAPQRGSVCCEKLNHARNVYHEDAEENKQKK